MCGQPVKLTRTGIILSYCCSCLGSQGSWQGLEWYCLIAVPVCAAKEVDKDWSDTLLFPLIWTAKEVKKDNMDWSDVSFLLLCEKTRKLATTGVIVLSCFCFCASSKGRWQGLEWLYCLVSASVRAAKEGDKDWSDCTLLCTVGIIVGKLISPSVYWWWCIMY